MIRPIFFATLLLAVNASAQPEAATSQTPAENTVKSPNISVLAKPGFGAAQAGKFEDAAALYEKTAQAGDNDSRWLLAGLHLSKKLKASSRDRARELLEAAAAEGHPASCHDLGSLLESGFFGGKPDPEKARFFFQQAAEGGHARSQYLMGQFALLPGPDKDEKIALEWLQKANSQNFVDAKFALVQFYDTGLAGVRADPQHATALCLEAAIGGSTLAMNEMGIRYQRGSGIAKDEVAAIGWFSLASQFNMAVAHINLGNCFELGRGCKQDFDIAGQHYAAASKLNHPVGQLLLANFFEDGKGTAKNPVHAYVLYTYAAAQNNQEAAKRRADLEKKLNKDQIQEAKKLLEGNFKP